MVTQPHIALLGDSILDNARYVVAGQAVVDHLRQGLGAGIGCSLVAVDGDTTRNVYAQLQRLPANTTHLVLSMGGNDALAWLPTLNQPAGSVMEALDHLQRIQAEFREHYEALLEQIRLVNKPTLVFTIYDAVPGLTPALRAALSLFNDVVLRTAMRHTFDIMELRDLLTQPEDYSSVSPIEPSEQAGKKLASAISKWVADA
ncbi:SGNH/GDSL hydrolase family protein [Hydrogenophaga atypica]|uniref:SGNH/GDSL hydrolase family protein n=1 Tax=Hydrogenophaga atypica TaxID=249409 RepID=A0ABW2QPM9_9BURK